MPLLNPLSGVGQYVQQLYQEIVALGVDTDFFYGYCWDNSLRAGAGPVVSRIERFSQNTVVGQKSVSLARKALFSIGSGLRRGYLYHEPNFIPLPTSAPYVMTVHDLSPLRMPETHSASLVKAFEKKLSSAIERAQAILVDSDFVKREMLHYFPDAHAKVKTVLLGVNESYKPLTEEASSPFLREANLEYGHYILTVGTLEPRKNLVSALKAYARLPQVLRSRYPLAMAGMKGWLNDELDQLVAPFVRRGEVRLLGFVPDNVLNALYSGARFLMYPSLYEGFGLPPLEAMACGTPVLCSNRASLPEVVGDAGIQIEPLDIEAMTNAMMQLLEDDSLHAVLRASGLKRSRQFTWRDTAINSLAVFDSVMAKVT